MLLERIEYAVGAQGAWTSNAEKLHESGRPFSPQHAQAQPHASYISLHNLLYHLFEGRGLKYHQGEVEIDRFGTESTLPIDSQPDQTPRPIAQPNEVHRNLMNVRYVSPHTIPLMIVRLNMRLCVTEAPALFVLLLQDQFAVTCTTSLSNDPLYCMSIVCAFVAGHSAMRQLTPIIPPRASHCSYPVVD